MNRTHAGCLLAWSALVISAVGVRADEASAKQKLASKGIRVGKSGLSSAEEVELGKQFGDAATLKRKLISATKELDAAEREEEEARERMRELLQNNIAVNAELAAVNPANVILHNKLVGMANANASAINLIVSDREKVKKEIDAARQSANSAREDYVAHLMRIRSQVDRIAGKYAAWAKDADVLAAVRDWNEAANAKLEVKPSRAFESQRKRLEALEKGVITDNIPLRREGNSYYASVVIDGKHAHEMVVDSGASLILLPKAIADQCGVTVGSGDPEITLVVASGSKIKGRLTRLDSVRVGKFTVQNVECAVLGPEASAAKPLLGMTFLGRFKVELNAQASQLTLMTVDAGGVKRRPVAAKTKKPAPKRHTRSKSSAPVE